MAGCGIMPHIGVEGNEYAFAISQRVRGGWKPDEVRMRKILPEPLTEKLKAGPRGILRLRGVRFA
jgi:hypothetical protein